MVEWVISETKVYNIKLNILTNFINGLRKSFNGRDYLREINQCKSCGKPSFFNSCLKCETDQAYRGWNKR